MKIYTFNQKSFERFKIEHNNSYVNTLSYEIMENIFKRKIEDSEFYLDITNFFLSGDKSKDFYIENVLKILNDFKNIKVIINENFKEIFKEKFITLNFEYEELQYEEDVKDKISNRIFDLSNLEIKKIENDVNQKLIGHKNFKEEFFEKLEIFPILYKMSEIKIFSILLCGNPGVGKTELAKILHNSLYKNSKLIKINFGNYKTEGALNSLIGSPKGYIGSENGGELSNKIKNSNSRVILIDEFEKANYDIFNFFYELLEDGKFTDLNENEFDLEGYIIIFTTNLNQNNYKNIIPEPLLSRMYLKYYFEQPSENEKKTFIDRYIKNLVQKYNELGIDKNNKITNKDISNKMDYDNIKNINDFRRIRKIVIDAFIKTIKKNDWKKY